MTKNNGKSCHDMIKDSCPWAVGVDTMYHYTTIHRDNPSIAYMTIMADRLHSNTTSNVPW